MEVVGLVMAKLIRHLRSSHTLLLLNGGPPENRFTLIGAPSETSYRKALIDETAFAPK
jgi:hypothetical protein